LIKLCTFNDKDYCPYCHTKHSIELYDIFNKSLNYRNILHLSNIESIIDVKQLSYFKCKNCNKEYKIEWDNGRPYPLTYNLNINYFLKKFMRRLK